MVNMPVTNSHNNTGQELRESNLSVANKMCTKSKFSYCCTHQQKIGLKMNMLCVGVPHYRLIWYQNDKKDHNHLQSSPRWTWYGIWDVHYDLGGRFVSVNGMVLVWPDKGRSLKNTWMWTSNGKNISDIIHLTFNIISVHFIPIKNTIVIKFILKTFFYEYEYEILQSKSITPFVPIEKPSINLCLLFTLSHNKGYSKCYTYLDQSILLFATSALCNCEYQLRIPFVRAVS